MTVKARSLGELMTLREDRCRLVPQRWLTTLDEARAFFADRRMMSLSLTSYVPSLFGACAPNPDPTARGFAALPPDKWWWGSALCEFPEVRRTKLLRGKVLLLDAALFEAISPLCLAELTRADDGAFGRDAQLLLAYLDQEGPKLVAEVKAALGFFPRELAKLRQGLEAVGALLSEDVEVPARSPHGHIHTSRVFRFDQAAGLAVENSADRARAHRQLLSTAVRAAVVAPREDVQRWFSWPAKGVIEALLDEGTLEVPTAGWLASTE
jgi:hypothetical protein